MTPDFRIDVAGVDASGAIGGSLAALRLSLSVEEGSDSLELRLSAPVAALSVPGAEREIAVALGYRETGLETMGTFFHSETELERSVPAMTIRATGADFCSRSRVKTAKTRSWDGVTLGVVVVAISAKYGLSVVLEPDLAALPLGHVDQSESDLHLLRRLGEEHDAIVHQSGQRLYLARRGAGKSATGAALPAFAPPPPGSVFVRPVRAAGAARPPPLRRGDGGVHRPRRGRYSPSPR